MLKKRFDTYIFFCLWSMSGVFGVDEVKLVSVMEGDSVTLNPDRTQIQRGDLKWRFGEIFIAKVNIENNERMYYNDSAGGRFRGRLELNQTGSLSITNTTTEHTGLYEVYSRNNINIPLNTFRLTVYAHLPVPVIISDSPNSSSSSSSSEHSSVSKCSLLCSAVNVSHVTLSWYKGKSVLSSIKMSDFNISLSLRLEIECLDDSYSCVINNSISNQTNLLNSTELCTSAHHTCADNSVSLIVLISAAAAAVGSLLIVAFGVFCICSKYRKTDKEVQTRSEEITYADPTFYKRKAQKPRVQVEDEVVYAGVAMRR